MFKRFSFLATLLLLVTMPLQSLAAANMLACASMANAALKSSINNTASETKATEHSACHEMPSNKADTVSSNTYADHSKHQNSTCKINCALMCTNLCAINAIVSVVSFKFSSAHTNIQPFQPHHYASITLPSFQRPPIFLA